MCVDRLTFTDLAMWGCLVDIGYSKEGEVLIDHYYKNIKGCNLSPSGHYMYRTAVTMCIAQWSLYVPHSGYYMYRTVVTIQGVSRL